MTNRLLGGPEDEEYYFDEAEGRLKPVRPAPAPTAATPAVVPAAPQVKPPDARPSVLRDTADGLNRAAEAIRRVPFVPYFPVAGVSQPLEAAALDGTAEWARRVDTPLQDLARSVPRAIGGTGESGIDPVGAVRGALGVLHEINLAPFTIGGAAEPALLDWIHGRVYAGDRRMARVMKEDIGLTGPLRVPSPEERTERENATLGQQREAEQQLFKDTWGPEAGRQWQEEHRASRAHDEAGRAAKAFWDEARRNGTLPELLKEYPERFNVHPKADMDKDVETARALGVAARGLALGDLTPGMPLVPVLTFVNLVRPYGDWDYKNVPVRPGAGQDQRYWDYGNFHYGVVAKAFGFSDEEVLRGAGAAQFLWERANAVGRALKWPVLNKPPNPHAKGTPDGGFPFGDEPRDQAAIAMGIEFYKRHYAPRHGRAASETHRP